jgi:hypothetical protein
MQIATWIYHGLDPKTGEEYELRNRMLRKAANMLERLGNVLYSTGAAIAGLLVLFLLFALAEAQPDDDLACRARPLGMFWLEHKVRGVDEDIEVGCGRFGRRRCYRDCKKRHS